jgi:hypothetical protein
LARRGEYGRALPVEAGEGVYPLGSFLSPNLNLELVTAADKELALRAKGHISDLVRMI